MFNVSSIPVLLFLHSTYHICKIYIFIYYLYIYIVHILCLLCSASLQQECKLILLDTTYNTLYTAFAHGVPDVCNALHLFCPLFTPFL